MTSTMAVIASATILAGTFWAAPSLAQRRDVRPLHPVTRGTHLSMPAHPVANPPAASHPGHARHGLGSHHHGGFAKRGFVGSGPIVLYTPGYAYTWPGYASGGPIYVDPGSSFGYGYGSAPASSYTPAYAYPPSASVTVAPPTPTVIEHATGRYELRGDGVTAPYRWVWVPNPPEAPPVTPPAVPPATPPSGPPPGEPAPRHTTIYRWTDRDGVVHLTDNPSSVPPEYRRKAQVPSL